MFGRENEDLDILLTHFFSSSRGKEYNLDPNTDGMFSKKYLLPWFRNVPQPACVKEKWSVLEKHQRLAAVCR